VGMGGLFYFMALRDQPYFPLYVKDFLTDEKLVECSAAATGVYIRLMCVMHKSEHYGKILLKQKYKQTPEQIKNFASMVAKQMPYDTGVIFSALTELVDENVLHIEGDFLLQKRMIKDWEISNKRASAGQTGGKKTQEKGKHFASTFAKAKSEANTEYEYEDENEIENVIKIENVVTKKKETREEIINPFGVSGAKIWDAWKSYKRDEHGKSYKSSKTEQQAINQLYDLSGGNPETALKIIQQSIGNQWQGLFELKNNNNGNEQPTKSLRERVQEEFSRRYPGSEHPFG
jgi:hypothetical protein